MQVCDFCRIVYSMRSAPDKNCIICYVGQYDIQVPDSDPYCNRYLVNVKYCPYCGRKIFSAIDI